MVPSPSTSPSRSRDPSFLSNTDPRLRPCWHPIAPTVEVGHQPVPVRLLGETWTLVRLPHPHPAPPAGSRPPPPARDVGGPPSTSGAGMGGAPVRATRLSDGAPPAGVRERDGMVFLAPDPPVTDLLEVEVADDPAYAVGWLRPVRARVGAGLMTDNFLDMAHFPFLHAATIGAGELTSFDDMVVTREGWGMTVESVHEFSNHEDPGVPEGVRPLVQRRRVRFVYRAPFMVSLRIDYLDAGGTNVVVLYVQPEDEQSCRLFSALYRNDLGPPDHHETRRRMAEAVRYETLVLDEDLALQTRYRDLRLPLDLRTEVHVRADRPTIELRRVLADLTVATSGG